jgi:hypothetical protein
MRALKVPDSAKKCWNSPSLLQPAPRFFALGGVDPEPGFLAEGWLRFETPGGPAVLVEVGPLEGPAFVDLQVVVVMAQEGQVARKLLIRSQAGLGNA